MILTGHVGTNAQLIAQVAKLYLKPGMTVADVTYGKGVFWGKVDPLPDPPVLASDIDPQLGCITKADFRELPYPTASIDVIVLDPPYMHGGATVEKSIAQCYGNKKTEYASHEKIIQLYHSGMREAYRVLKRGGLLWVKCQDEIESGKQRWSHVEILDFATHCNFLPTIGAFTAQDLFVLVQSTIPARRQSTQHHARKNHSYLWIFKKR